MGDKQSVYIVEDEATIRELEIYALKNSEFEVTGFESGKSLMAQLEIKVPDIILLDIMLPEEDGLAFLGTIRQTGAYVVFPVIMVTAKTREIDAVKGLDLGADDYITKPFGVMELVSRVKAVLRRSGKQLDKTKLSVGGISIDSMNHDVKVDGEQVVLTLKEFELLEKLMRNQGIVLTRDQLLTEIWGYDFDGETRTVDAHIRTLRQKLGEQGSLVKTVRGVGYRIGGEA